MRRVTVCMAVYNGATTISDALASVRAQTYRDYDLLVLDDGSNDASAALAAQFGAKVITVPNGGLGAARKLLVEISTGEWIAFIDHDDTWDPRKLEVQMAALEESGAVLCHTDCWYMHEDGSTEPRDLVLTSGSRSFDHVVPYNKIIASSAVFHRQAMLDAGNFVDDTVRCSDWYGWFMLAPHGDFLHLPEKLVRYQVLRSSLANAGFRFYEAQHYLLTQKILPRRSELFGALPSDVRARYTKLLTRDVGLALSGMSSAKRQMGDRRVARRLSRQALRLAPDALKVWSRALWNWAPF